MQGNPFFRAHFPLFASESRGHAARKRVLTRKDPQSQSVTVAYHAAFRVSLGDVGTHQRFIGGRGEDFAPCRSSASGT